MHYHDPRMADPVENQGASNVATVAPGAAAAVRQHDAAAYGPDYAPFNTRLNRSTFKQQPLGPMIRITLAWIAGILLASVFPFTAAWLIAACIAAGLCLALRHQPAVVRPLGIAAVVALGASWFLIRDHHVARDHLSHYVTAEPQLAKITGIIETPAVVTASQRGPFASFAYQSPSTTFVVNVRTIVVDGIERTTRGRLLAKLRQAETRYREGDQVAITGWMQAIDGPSNPGEFDFAAMLAGRGIDGRITMNVRGNCIVTKQGSTFSGLNTLRSEIADACSASLRQGLENDPVRLAFLDTILLGRWSRELDELSESFRRTGLTHVLSISGAHLTILMLLVWAVVHLFVRHPSRAAMVVLTVLLLYMMAIPWRTPIVRAGIMAGLVCLGAASGRQVRVIDMISLSALVVFIWRPSDVFDAGAQLSFGVVAALIVFTPRVSQWIHADPLFVPPADETRAWIVRRCCDYLAINLVAFLVTLPIVAYHFQFISPLSMFLSLLSLPVVTAVIGLGYLKILLGFLLSSAGMVLGGPLEWVSDSMTGLVDHASRWPASTVALGSAPSGLWLVVTLALVCALMAGWFAGRRLLLSAAVVGCTLWLLIPHHPRVGAWVDSMRTQPAMRINMFAVGDGSCFLVRIAGDENVKPHVMMFDCGSLGFLEVGSRSIVPALRSMNVNHIDTLFISHADLDHFCGVLDVIKDVPIGRVLVPPQLMREAEKDAKSAAAFLIQGLQDRRLRIEEISRGWSEKLGSANADILWPPADFTANTANSSSLVLSLRAAGKRVLLNGDIDQVAIPQLLAMGDDLRADIADLPHHGSFVRSSPRWFEAVRPRIVLQSSGRTRLRADLWSQLLSDPKITRLITARLGMVELTIEADREVKWSAFRSQMIAEEP